MTISEWLDKKMAKGIDVAHIEVPTEMMIDEAPDETIYFKEIRSCSILCPEDHPFATVERFGDWYYARGRDKEASRHTTLPLWWLWTRDKPLALRTAEAHIEKE
ncbi:MAG: hypothetical protein WCX84_10015 [Syntrophales bacterium]|jgi:hypothetical protein|nr:hypothetical protein [Syntrophales bacterium]